jgi:hypothetical protein
MSPHNAIWCFLFQISVSSLSLTSPNCCLCLLSQSSFLFIFPLVLCFRRRSLCKMQPINFAFLRFTIPRIFLSALGLRTSNTSLFLTRSVQLIFSILHQHHISKLSKYFWSTFRTVQLSAYTKLCSERSTSYVALLNYVHFNVPAAWTMPCWFNPHNNLITPTIFVNNAKYGSI